MRITHVSVAPTGDATPDGNWNAPAPSPVAQRRVQAGSSESHPACPSGSPFGDVNTQMWVARFAPAGVDAGVKEKRTTPGPPELVVTKKHSFAAEVAGTGKAGTVKTSGGPGVGLGVGVGDADFLPLPHAALPTTRANETEPRRTRAFTRVFSTSQVATGRIAEPRFARRVSVAS